jgi:hypothetical protein
MGIMEILGVAGSLSLLAGWRLYLTIFVTGIAMHFSWLPLPDHLQSLQVLANPWVLSAAAAGTIAEFLADKIAWFDSAWDMVHSFIRPIGGALLTLAVVDASDPVWQIVALILGGGGALISHGAKASTRAAVNLSPEPFSNAVVSSGEDVATTGLLALVIAFPALGIVIALLLLVAALLVIYALRRLAQSAGKLLKRQPIPLGRDSGIPPQPPAPTPPHAEDIGADQPKY